VSDQEPPKSRKSEAAFRTISEVAAELNLPQHVLRFWESKFSQVKPLKRGGGRRYYRPEDVVLLKRIRTLLYDDGLTIKGVQKLFRDHSVKTVIDGESGPANTLITKTDEPIGSVSAKPNFTVLLADLKSIRDDLRAALAVH
jgi:DNA-binding transcriptional MerR regulator